MSGPPGRLFEVDVFEAVLFYKSAVSEELAEHVANVRFVAAPKMCVLRENNEFKQFNVGKGHRTKIWRASAHV